MNWESSPAKSSSGGSTWEDGSDTGPISEEAPTGSPGEKSGLPSERVAHVVHAPEDGDCGAAAGFDPAVVCENALWWARERNYEGYDPYDGLNSPLLSRLAGNWITRLIAIHGVRAFPGNVRPYLGVPRERNPMGIGLFARAYLSRYAQTGTDAYLREAEALLDWLVANCSPAFETPSWGYNFDWQNSNKFFLPAYHPSGVVTVTCARAFLRHYELTNSERSLDVLRGVKHFLRSEINTVRIRGYEAFAYTPYDSFVVVNANALIAEYLYRVGSLTGDQDSVERAAGLFELIVEVQTEAGGWHYALPAAESHLDYDNFHTGFVLESLHDYAHRQGRNHPVRRAYERGLEFHRSNHFRADGAPKFEATSEKPYDIHNCAQALITFSQRNEPEDRKLARRVLGWTLQNMYDPTGNYFYRRVGRILTDRTPYVRWSQAWMCLALTKYLGSPDDPPPDPPT